MPPVSPPATRKPLDRAGFWMLFLLAVLFAGNNVLIKLGNGGLQPVFFAAMRSLVAGMALLLWMWLRAIPLRLDLWRGGALIGLAFAAEFFFLFIALDKTTVVRASVIFYAMPLWLALMAHWLFPGDQLTPRRLAGFVLGFSGVVLTLVSGRAALEGGSILGDLAALAGGIAWALIIVCARLTRLQGTAPETQLMWQFGVSAPVLMALAPLYGGSLVREFDHWHLALFLVHTLGIVTIGFLVWFWLLARYPASSVASFSFLTPALAVALGWLVLDEPIATTTPVAVAALLAGLFLINRRT